MGILFYFMLFLGAVCDFYLKTVQFWEIFFFVILFYLIFLNFH
jgi:hypothetical protein